MGRIHFVLEQNRPLRSVVFVLFLEDGFVLKQSTHFRAVFHLQLLGSHNKPREIAVAVCDESPIRASQFSGGRCNCILHHWAIRDWTKKKGREWPPGGGAGVWPDNMTKVVASAEYSDLFFDPSAPNLVDLDRAWEVLFVNKSLADKVTRLIVYANEYKMLDLPRGELTFDNPNSEPDAPWQFSDSELNDKWVRVMQARGGPAFRFSESTPKRMYQPKGIDHKKSSE